MSGNETEEFFLIFVFPLFTYLSHFIIQMHSKAAFYCILFTECPNSELLNDLLIRVFLFFI